MLSTVLPGLPQAIAGRWGSGAMALLTWVGLLTVLVTRSDRVTAALGGAWDDRLAVLTLVAGLVASWAWSWRDLTSPVGVERSV